MFNKMVEVKRNIIVDPILTQLDVEKSGVICKCIQMAEKAGTGKGVQRMVVFKLYLVEMTLQQDNLAMFNFEDQLLNTYRSGVFYADKDYNKISFSKL